MLPDAARCLAVKTRDAIYHVYVYEDAIYDVYVYED